CPFILTPTSSSFIFSSSVISISSIGACPASSLLSLSSDASSLPHAAKITAKVSAKANITILFILLTLFSWHCSFIQTHLLQQLQIASFRKIPLTTDTTAKTRSEERREGT